MRLKNIGFVFQGFNLFPTLTAGENVELMLDLKGIRGGKAKERTRSSSWSRWGCRRSEMCFPRT